MPELTQRRLVLELRLAIDAARSKPNPSPHALEHVATIVRENPHGVHSTHVQYNIGSARRAWLSGLITEAKSSSITIGEQGPEVVAISPRSTTR